MASHRFLLDPLWWIGQAMNCIHRPVARATVEASAQDRSLLLFPSGAQASAMRWILYPSPFATHDQTTATISSSLECWLDTINCTTNLCSKQNRTGLKWNLDRFLAKQVRDGQWGAWSKWTKCTRVCGGGRKTRHRFCGNPAPAHGGRDCDGERIQEAPCNTNKCPGK